MTFPPPPYQSPHLASVAVVVFFLLFFLLLQLLLQLLLSLLQFLLLPFLFLLLQQFPLLLLLFLLLFHLMLWLILYFLLWSLLGVLWDILLGRSACRLPARPHHLLPNIRALPDYSTASAVDFVGRGFGAPSSHRARFRHVPRGKTRPAEESTASPQHRHPFYLAYQNVGYF